jgi:diketogulonate reductase-like aldo/keto reductase
VKREDLFITSKVWPTWFAKGRPMTSAKRILKSLEMDYLDLLLINWPTPFKQVDHTFWPVDEDDQCQLDEDIEMIDVWKEFEQIKKEGLARSIGVSNFNSRQLDDLIKNSSTVPAVNEVESHPFNTNSKLLKWMNERGVEMIAYSPLAKAGMKDKKTPSPLEVPLIEYIAMSYNKTPADICLKWQTQRNVIAIPKSSTEQRIKSNINIFDFWLSEKEMASIEDLNKDMRNYTWDVFGIEKHKNWPFKIPF